MARTYAHIRAQHMQHLHATTMQYFSRWQECEPLQLYEIEIPAWWLPDISELYVAVWLCVAGSHGGILLGLCCKHTIFLISSNNKMNTKNKLTNKPVLIDSYLFIFTWIIKNAFTIKNLNRVYGEIQSVMECATAIHLWKRTIFYVVAWASVRACAHYSLNIFR